MNELFNASFSTFNIIPTGLMVFVVIYWVTVILGILDFSFLDFDIELDLDTDVEVDADVDAEGEVSVAWLNQILGFFNLGKIPFMVFLSFWALPMWIISVLVNYYTGNISFLIALALLVPNMIVSLFISKFLTMPFITLFGRLEAEEGQKSMIGKVCEVYLPVSTDKMGQARVSLEETSLLLSVKTTNGINLQPGESGLIVDYNENERYYLIEPYETL